MNTDTAENKTKVVLDTNIIISALGFGGKPRKILNLVLDKQIQAVSSTILLAELEDVIFKKFPLLATKSEKIYKQIKKKFKIVKPRKSIKIIKDEPDNRVLEAAFEGKCQYIVTGDKELLNLGIFEEIKILTVDKFISIFENN